MEITPSLPEQPSSLENKTNELDLVPKHQLAELRALLENTPEDQKKWERLKDYRLQLETEVNQKKSEEFSQAQIALLVHMAIVKHELGDKERCLEELEAAYDYAFNMYMDDATRRIEALIDKVLSEGVD